ncbi:MAG: precorrin-6y C5,15-methyltransferase (decarboxylating) subunit CbiE [Clostridia bacterium]|nr:precorrin-6y C5,15-methyltransferase (decarboxylating) subunit CbiE [Clostridia bacterium]
MNSLYVVGLGPGSKDYILPAAKELVNSCDVLIGGKRNLELFELAGKESLEVGNNLDDILAYIKDNINSRKIAVLVTGDPGLYSLTAYLNKNLHGIRLEIIPGISSLQYLCCKLNMSSEDIAVTSLHGREQKNFISLVRENRKLAVFAGGGNSPGDICRRLLNNHITDVRVTVGENLSYPNERIVSASPAEILEMSFSSLCLMIIENEKSSDTRTGVWPYLYSGIPDELFIRGDVPMTKEEVRTVSVSKLRLHKDSVVVDIGAGTGSVSVECGLRCRHGKVYAVEKNPEAIALISENITKFGVSNVEVLHGMAPEALTGIDSPDRVFIGGSCGSIQGILDWVKGHAKPVRVVANAVTLENVFELIKGFEDKGFSNLEVVNIAAARGRSVGGKHLMQALNPVYIISCDWGQTLT